MFVFSAFGHAVALNRIVAVGIVMVLGIGSLILGVHCVAKSTCPRCGAKVFAANVETNTPGNLWRNHCPRCELRF